MPQTTVSSPAFEKCGVYWCRFGDGNTCTLRNGDSMKNAVCIKDHSETREFFRKKPKRKTEKPED